MLQTNLQNTKKYVRIIFGITFIFILITLLAILIGPKNPPNSKTQQNTPITKEDFTKKLPYTSQEFGIIYNSNQQLFYINVFKEPYEQNRQNALVWIKNQNVDPATLKIFYSPSSQFKSLNPK